MSELAGSHSECAPDLQSGAGKTRWLRPCFLLPAVPHLGSIAQADRVGLRAGRVAPAQFRQYSLLRCS